MNINTEKLKPKDEETKHVFNSITTSKVLSDLQKRGFSYLFKLKEESICCKDYSIGFDEFDIVEVHSLATASQAEQHVLYAIKCDKHSIKGIIINPFEIYANAFLNICINKILNNEKLRFEYYNSN